MRLPSLANLPPSRLGPLLLDLAAVALIFIPTNDWDQSPYDGMRDLFWSLIHSPWPRSWHSWSDALTWMAALIPYLIAAVCLVAQLRSFRKTAWQLWERRILLAAVVFMAMAICVSGSSLTRILIGINDDITPSQPLSYRLNVAVLTLVAWIGIPCLVLVMLRFWWQRLHPVLFFLALLRILFLLNILCWMIRIATEYGLYPDLQPFEFLLAIGVAIAYAREAMIFLVFGSRHVSGSARYRMFRLWLPDDDATPQHDVALCVECGYDLRGTIPTASRICPECGSAFFSA